MKKKILIILGTRPEIIKLAPVYLAFRENDNFDVRLLVTAQHRSMLDQSLINFNIKPDYDLDIMKDNQDLFDVSAQALNGIKAVLADYKPDYVVVQGDTTSTFIGSLAAYYNKIPVVHVEAGLRTHNKYSPFPEEVNRRLTSCIADIHCPPTQRSKENLLAENISEENIEVTGNTAIDALLWVINNKSATFESELSKEVCDAIKVRFILVTTHRRESFGKPMENVMRAIYEIANEHPDIGIIFPVHLNPNVKKQVEKKLLNVSNIHLIEPMDYVNFSHLMNQSFMILTDSGGIQEEAPSLKKPVLVLRDTTERPEGIEAGAAKLVGTNKEKIKEETSRLLTDTNYYNSMITSTNPYGDGSASKRIVESIVKRI